jgi:RNA polymerase sigma-70 factor (ECF subfamily)
MAETIGAAREEAERVDRLVRGLRAGDSAAHAELCARFGRRLHRCVAALLGPRGEAAEDLMVEALVEAARNIGRFDGRKGTFTTWLFGIARRQVQLELRRQRQRKSVPDSVQAPLDSLSEQPHPQDLAEATAARLQAERQVAKLVGYLSDTEMEVLVLRCMHELSIREIANVLGRSERAIDSLLDRAKRKARERLAEDAGTD